MPIKHKYKSLASKNEKNILLSQLFFNCDTNEKTKITLFYVKFFNASMHFNYDFDFIFFIKAYDTSMKC